MTWSKPVVGALVLCSALAAAAPTNPGAAFTMEQVAIPKRARSGAQEYARALAKYKATVPASVAAAAESGTATNNPSSGDEEYVVQVTVGGSKLNLDFDTGSADLWVFSTETPSSESTGHNIYKPSSSAEKLSGYTWSISYGDGSSASGNVYQDSVTVGGVTATKQAVEAAETVSSEFTEDTSNDGLLGLAFSSINTVEPTAQITFFDTVKTQLASPLFAVTLKHDAPGYYDFGFIDSSRYTGNLVYTEVDNSDGFWSFTSDSYSIGGEHAGSGLTGIADTGTTLLLLDDSVVSAYYAQVSGSEDSSSNGGYTFPCTADLPDFSITISGYEAVVPGKYINFEATDSSNKTCFGGIQSNSGIGFSIFGDVFLKSQYIVFDSSVPQLGFAAQS
ncbi:hypothetical protein P175DRAFT_0466299 [Aspergillus ochraceoroseus IBT 24754]|uniref:Aspergillopepsin-1 n=3 Tax=Aspergillus subgen. Nidulantes TaxID=2720870 RepID=A0A0F8XV53_9EURO|nr:uncharacterized protein P175DRAFT_0466299 [Aspergillus ochraceoroseus IBT 24754]KKK15635.1 hypothetical protein AOCH_005496 [Aspergillus ochraceoroseus]KKK27362.1 hypothetical protein ARAM_004103 [Aspergillus rambellii]PTU17959.1 hypothetical protein P175DRAFT_0466299 [Aspergillus ochraceoroseus IBT 24754]